MGYVHLLWPRTLEGMVDSVLQVGLILLLWSPFYSSSLSYMIGKTNKIDLILPLLD